MIHRYVLRDKKQSFSEETLYSIIQSQIVTEKSNNQQEKNQYFFEVARWSNKISIKKAFEHIFNVEVDSVQTLCVKGKTRRFKGRHGVTKSIKKAIISLKAGQHLDIAQGAKL